MLDCGIGVASVVKCRRCIVSTIHCSEPSFAASARSIAGENGLVLTLRSAGAGTPAGLVPTDATEDVDDAGTMVGGDTPAGMESVTSSNRDTAGPSWTASGVLAEAGVAGGGSTCENARRLPVGDEFTPEPTTGGGVLSEPGIECAQFGALCSRIGVGDKSTDATDLKASDRPMSAKTNRACMATMSSRGALGAAGSGTPAAAAARAPATADTNSNTSGYSPTARFRTSVAAEDTPASSEAATTTKCASSRWWRTSGNLRCADLRGIASRLCSSWTSSKSVAAAWL